MFARERFGSNPKDTVVHFLRIIMQQGQPEEKLAAKIMEIDQTLFVFRFDISLLYKDKRELKKSRYKTAFKKLSFFRLLRKSYVGRVPFSDEKVLETEMAKVLERGLHLTSTEAHNLKQSPLRPVGAAGAAPLKKD